MAGEGVTAERLALVRKLFGSGFRISRWYFGAPGAPGGHDGIDLPARAGTPIRALASGQVSYARDARTDPNAARAWALGGGKVVNIDVDSRYTTQYAHMQDVFVKPGQFVKAGTIIGTVGSTGGLPNSPGANFGASNAHVHFGLWDHKVNKMVVPDAFLQATATGETFGEQGAWADQVKFPTGHVLTAADVDKIIDTLDRNGWFDNGTVVAGVTGPVARGITREVLMRHVGEKWNKELLGKLQSELLASADQADDLGGVTTQLAILGDFVAKATDPANWVRIFAILAGAGLVAVGGMGVLRATGTAPSVTIPRPGGGGEYVDA